MTRELPILYSGPMVRACLAGAKTQTRRLPPRALWGDVDAMLAWGLRRFGDVGDVLWVRETWAHEDCGEDGARVVYRADRAAWWHDVEDLFFLASDYEPAGGWRPSIHMPRWACRLRRRRTAPLRIEFVQDITEASIRAEGITAALVGEMTGKLFGEHELGHAWEAAWDRINGSRATYAQNPPLVVVTHSERYSVEPTTDIR